MAKRGAELADAPTAPGPALSPRTRQSVLTAAAILATALGLIFLALAGSNRTPARPPTPGLPLGAFDFTTDDEPGEAALEVTLAAQDYQHPSGAFALHYPRDWQIDESENEARFVGPNDSAEIVIQFDAPAGAIDLAAYLERWVTARYGAFPDFILGQQIEQGDGSRLLLAAFTGDDEIHRAAGTFAEEHDGVIFTESFVAVTGLHDAYLPAFVEIANSFQYDARTARAAAGGAAQFP